MSDNIIAFPTSKITPEELIAQIVERVQAGEVQSVMVVTMNHKTEVKCCMSTLPAHHAVFMNQLQRLSIEHLMREGNMTP